MVSRLSAGAIDIRQTLASPEASYVQMQNVVVPDDAALPSRARHRVLRRDELLRERDVRQAIVANRRPCGRPPEVRARSIARTTLVGKDGDVERAA
jgi:hypothetical protein